jgi:hypothetical protein
MVYRNKQRFYIFFTNISANGQIRADTQVRPYNTTRHP